MTADLAARLEAATDGSRELSNEVLRCLGWSENVNWLEGARRIDASFGSTARPDAQRG